MKILAVSDQVVESLYSPAVRRVAAGVDLVISCGDLPSAYLEYLMGMLETPLFYVMGNHGGAGGDKEFPEGGENLDGRVLRFRNRLFAGLEGSRRYNLQPRYQYGENEMQCKVWQLIVRLAWNRLRYGRWLDVLVTHAPPFGIHDQPDLPHTGFRAFLRLINLCRPHYLLHGHIHVYDNRAAVQTLRGATLVVNTYGYRVLDLPD